MGNENQGSCRRTRACLLIQPSQPPGRATPLALCPPPSRTRPPATTKAFAALPPGGALIALDCIIDDARRANRWGLYMSLSMLTEFEEGGAFDYTFEEFDRWSKDVGFERTEYLHLGGPNGAAITHKAGPPPRRAAAGSGFEGGDSGE